MFFKFGPALLDAFYQGLHVNAKFVTEKFEIF
jgi:hypothetical protein